MNKTKNIQYILVFALAVAVSLSFPLEDAKAYTCGDGSDAATICSDPVLNCDSDADGYLDTEECGVAGWEITLKDANDSNATVTYSYAGCATGLDTCLDPTQKDLFLIIVPADDPDNESCPANTLSLLPADLLYPTAGPQPYWLGLTVHTIKNSQVSGLTVGDFQKAVKMTEDCSTDDPDVAGDAIAGLPTLGVSGQVYSHVIQNKIISACAGKTCYEALSDGSKVTRTVDYLTQKHIVNTFNHELGHMMGLSVNIDRKIGNHWKVGTGAELDQFVDCTTKGSSTTCTIPDVHPGPDIAGFRLR
ncbi:MAG: hypothetical protein OEM01_12400 [Desulfobulbaceae bacterium]|nr:hypothetical protein [Desulfobulbaceae bacterium]